MHWFNSLNAYVCTAETKLDHPQKWIDWCFFLWLTKILYGHLNYKDCVYYTICTSSWLQYWLFISTLAFVICFIQCIIIIIRTTYTWCGVFFCFSVSCDMTPQISLQLYSYERYRNGEKKWTQSPEQKDRYRNFLTWKLNETKDAENTFDLSQMVHERNESKSNMIALQISYRQWVWMKFWRMKSVTSRRNLKFVICYCSFAANVYILYIIYSYVLNN